MDFGESSYEEFRDNLVNSLVELTQSSKFLLPSEVSFLRADSRNAAQLDSISDKILEGFNQTIQYSSVKDSNQEFSGLNDFLEHFDLAGDAIDNMFEKADIFLDSIKKKSSQISTAINPTQTQNAAFGQFKAVLRPQLKFKDKVDNSNTPWVPIIKHKPNSKQPLKAELSPEMKNHLASIGQQEIHLHPYDYEIRHIEFPKSLFQIKDEQMYLPMESTPFTWVDTLEGLETLCKVLENSKEIAVDLEHHDFRSFQGFTCLMQISTRDQDFMVDTLELRSELYRLNESFTNPNIIKVFHGANMDVQWLQRDFGVYIVNLFDTYQASQLLEMEKHSFAHLLQYYCQVETNKKYQLADWRIRPLTKEMIHYARTDTHYLLYIFDKMRNELLKRGNEGNNLIKAALERSAETSLIIYEKSIYDAENGEGNNGWRITKQKSPDPMNNENFAVFRALHAWRDHIARKEDESLRFVLPNHMLFNLCRTMPITAKDILSVCSPTPSLVRLYCQELAVLISETLEQVRQNPTIIMESPKVNTPKKLSEPAALPEPIKPQYQKLSSHKVVVKVLTKSSTFGKIFDNQKQHSRKEKADKIRSELKLIAPALDIQDEPEPEPVKYNEQDPLLALPKPQETKKEPEAIQESQIEVYEDDNNDEIVVLNQKKIDQFEPYDYSKAADPLNKKRKADQADPFMIPEGPKTKVSKPRNRAKSSNKSMTYK
ncbi:Exosome component 10 [Boothiomyces macroporosus]|uniref:Exosome component 10 n=1 Tax=Boothiomyces macroporosus TaxID=261099 RepID=A0AAD5UH01_9FUNG|nr:Exosome component 10 [Boothiomyces macroporosus]